MEETMLDLILDCTKKMYAEMQENHKQIKDRLEDLENTVLEIKTKISENSKNLEKELESIQEDVQYIKYNT